MDEKNRRNQKSTLYRKRTVLTAFFLCFFLWVSGAQATEEGEKTGETDDTGAEYIEMFSDYLDYSELDGLLAENEELKEYSFSGYVKELLCGDASLSVGGILRVICNYFLQSFQTDTGFFCRLLVLTAVSSFFSVMAASFQDGQAAETGFQVAFLILFALLLKSYLQAAELALKTVQFLLRFLQFLVPVYLTTISFCTGITTANSFYQIYITLITMCQSILVSVFFPLCNLYVMSGVGGQLASENYLSEFTSLVKKVIVWGKRGMLAMATGFSVIQGILAPGVDQLKRNTWVKSLAGIPGIGALFSGVTETVFSAGVVIKNAVGTAGILLILLACVRPLLQLFAYMFLFRIVGACVKLYADRKIAACFTETAEAIELLLGLVFAAMLSFLIVMVVLAVTTSGT